MIGFALTAFSWFRSTWIGKAIAIAIGVLLAVLFIRRSGYKARQQEEAVERAKAIKTKMEIENEVEALPDDARRDELGRFVRKRPPG